MIVKKKIVKFITYDGILEPIGESQVLSYAKYLSKAYSIKILSFEKKIDLKNKNRVNNFKKELNKFDISWKFKKYHKYPLFTGSLLDIFNGIVDNLIDIYFYKIKNFHIRGPIPGLTILYLLNFFKIKFIFDMRGFWADEKVDRLNWNKNRIFYKFFKKVEKKLIIKSQSIICLTGDAKEILIRDLAINKNKIDIIPTCVNTNEFKLSNYNKKNYINFCHLGSIETAYNIDKVLEIFLYFLKCNSKNRILFFTNQDASFLKKKILKYKIPDKNYLISNINKSQLIKKMGEIDLAIFYCNKNYSIQASFPTKIGEFLSSGIPILCNDFNKDIKRLISQNKVGLISNFKKNNYLLIYKKIKILIKNKQIRKKCRKIAEDKLSLMKGSEKLLKLYENSF